MNGPTAQQFQQQCQAFDDQPSSEAAHQLRSTVEEELPQQYQIPYETVVEDLEYAKSRHYRGLWHELVQHLTDLRYLTQQDFETYHKRRQQHREESQVLLPVLLAVRQYLTEEDWPALAEMFQHPPEKLQLFQLEEHLGNITERISRYTTFDGELPPPTDYQVGMKNCYGRSLAFRIRTLFTLDDELQDIVFFETQHRRFLYSFQNTVGQNFLSKDADSAADPGPIPAACWRMLCDIDEIYTSYKDARPPGVSKNKIVLSYNLAAMADLETLGEEDITNNESTRSTAGRGRRKAKAYQKISDSGYHLLGIRILQIKLWQTHFYVGAVDGEWGAVSHEAVLNLIGQEKELLHEKKRRKHREKGGKKTSRKDIKNAFFVNKKETVFIGFVALYELLQNYHTEKVEVSGTKTEREDDMILLLKELKENEGVDETTIDQRILQQQDDRLHHLYPDPQEKPQRRVAFARKSFLQGIWRGIKRVAKWIKEGVKQLLGPVFGFVKLLLSKIRAGVQQFFRGFRYLAHFLMGRPIVTLGRPVAGSDTLDVFATKFSLDFDGINFVSNQAKPADIQRHTNHIRDMKESMFYFIDMTLQIIKVIGKLSQPGGWVWLGWQIARLVAGDLVDVVQGGV